MFPHSSAHKAFKHYDDCINHVDVASTIAEAVIPYGVWNQAFRAIWCKIQFGVALQLAVTGAYIAVAI